MIVEHAILPVRWKQALHHFSDPCPLVEHFIPVFDSERGSIAPLASPRSRWFVVLFRFVADELVHPKTVTHLPVAGAPWFARQRIKYRAALGELVEPSVQYFGCRRAQQAEH